MSPGPAADGAPGPRPRGLPRARRLKRRRLIRPLFERDCPEVGRLAVGVVQVRWRVVPRAAAGADTPLQVGFAPGRSARTKVGRNRVRRVMREAWRLHQGPLLARFAARPAETLTVFVVFRGREAAAAAVRRDLPEAVRRLDVRLAGLPPAAPARQ